MKNTGTPRPRRRVRRGKRDNLSPDPLPAKRSPPNATSHVPAVPELDAPVSDMEVEVEEAGKISPYQMAAPPMLDVPELDLNAANKDAVVRGPEDDGRPNKISVPEDGGWC